MEVAYDQRAVARFERHVRREQDGCHTWTGGKHSFGYGSFWHDGATRNAARWNYERVNGPIPKGLELRHKCLNKSCVNPDHMETGTHTDNMRDKYRDGTMPHGETHHEAKLTEAQIGRALEMRRGNVSWARIGRALGVDKATVARAVSGQTWSHLEPADFPKRVQSSMTPDRVQEAIRLRKEGWAWRKIAGLFGVEHGSVMWAVKRYYRDGGA